MKQVITQAFQICFKISKQQQQIEQARVAKKQKKVEKTRIKKTRIKKSV